MAWTEAARRASIITRKAKIKPVRRKDKRGKKKRSKKHLSREDRYREDKLKRLMAQYIRETEERARKRNKARARSG